MFRRTLNLCYFVLSITSIHPFILQAESFQGHFEQAEEYLAATLFDEAILLYQLVLQDPSLSLTDQLPYDYVKIRLAQAFFAEKKYQDLLALLENHPIETPWLEQTRLYLIALTYRSMDKPEESIAALKEFLKSADSIPLPYDNEAKLEMGINLFQLQNNQESKPYFESIVEKGKRDDTYFLALIYLSRLALGEKKIEESEYRLNQAESLLPEDHLLTYETAYWHGRVCYEKGDYPKAIHYFENCSPRHRKEQSEWYLDSLYHMGLAYLALGNIPSPLPDEQKKYLLQAERLLDQIIQKDEKHPSENAYLALAAAYLSLFRHFGEEKAWSQADSILSRPDIFLSLEGRAQALLLKAQSETTYEKRDHYFKLLTDETWRETSCYPQGWYYYALNDFQEANLKPPGDAAASKLFEQAAYSFGQALHLLENCDRPLFLLSAKFRAEALLNQHTFEGNLKAFHVLNPILKNYSSDIRNLPDPGEIYYLQGYTASLLSAKGEEFKESAKKNLSLCSNEFPNSPFKTESLYLLGCLLFNSKEYPEAEETFLKLTQSGAGKHTGDAFFWLAKCMAKQQKNSQEIAQFRRKVYEEFPESLYAAEAYFTLYTYKSYMQGDKQAIKHLLGFKNRFPNSPFLINAYYLTGMDAKRDRTSTEGKSVKKKNLKEAIEALILAETAFDPFMKRGIFTEDNLNYYIHLRYLCTLERALANLAIADDSQGAKRRIFLEYSEEVLQNLFNDFHLEDHPLTQRLLKLELYPRILEESTYWLSHVHSKNQNFEAAEGKLREMLDNYRKAKITRGYFLSRVYYDLGIMAAQKKEYQTALKYYLFSEDAAKGKLISNDQKIDLWIQQSLCYRELDELDKAMLFLSRAINDEAVSSLRIKAMYLRADLYTLQGRHELARKQLESASRNSGEWAQKAKQKLIEEYGYQ